MRASLSAMGIWNNEDCISSGIAAGHQAAKKFGKKTGNYSFPNPGGWLNPIDIYPETGDATTRSEYYTQYIGLPEDGKFLSNSFYDTPWHFSSPREINFFIRFDYK